METRFKPSLVRRLKKREPEYIDRFQKQAAQQVALKPRGQLSGAVAETKRGREVNALRHEPIIVSANHPQGQLGPWFIK